MPAPLVVAGVAARIAAKKLATKAAKKSATKVAKSAAQKSKTNQIAKNSVKVKPANKTNPSNATLNSSENVRLKRMKSGDLAKGQARLEEKRNQISNQFFGKPKTVKINATAKNSKTTTKSNYKTPSLAKTQAKGVAKLAGAGVGTGAFTQIPAVKESIKRQVEQANKNKKPVNKTSTKKK